MKIFDINNIFPKRNYNRRYPKDYGIIRAIHITLFVYFVCWPIALLFYGVKVKGRKNIERKKRYIYTANHQSYIDPPLVSIAANVPVAYMAKEELFSSKSFLLRFLVISLGSFAVNREKLEPATVKTLLDIMKHTDWSIGIFPQGKTDFGVRKFGDVKTGFINISKMAKMDIVPIAISNFRGYNLIPFKENVVLKIGKPIPYTLPEEEILSRWVEYMENNVE